MLNMDSKNSINDIKKDDNIENRLLNIISQYQRLNDEFERRNKNNLQIILLVGQTGSGKSTIFNLLAGAGFQLRNDPLFGEELVVTTENFSPIKAGMTSITKDPYYHFIDTQNQLLIDFPGFSDTRGEVDQLLVQLFFHKLVTKVNVKIVYVLRYPENQFIDRGKDFQDFIKAEFDEQNINVFEFTILLNSYCLNLNADVLIQQFQKQVKDKYGTIPQKVLVIPNLQNQIILQNIISTENREKLLTKIINSNSIKIQPKIIPNSQMVTDYIRNFGITTIKNYCSFLDEKIQSIIIDTMAEEVLEQLLHLLEKLITIFELKQVTCLVWFEHFCDKCDNMAKILGIQRYKIAEYGNFMIIFKFFSELSNFISGYQEFNDTFEIASHSTDKAIEFIKMRIKSIKDQRDNEQKMENKDREIQELHNRPPPLPTIIQIGRNEDGDDSEEEFCQLI